VRGLAGETVGLGLGEQLAAVLGGQCVAGDGLVQHLGHVLSIRWAADASTIDFSTSPDIRAHHRTHTDSRLRAFRA
jgi:hypothetical protein